MKTNYHEVILPKEKFHDYLVEILPGYRILGSIYKRIHLEKDMKAIVYVTDEMSDQDVINYWANQNSLSARITKDWMWEKTIEQMRNHPNSFVLFVDDCFISEMIKKVKGAFNNGEQDKPLSQLVDIGGRMFCLNDTLSFVNEPDKHILEQRSAWPFVHDGFFVLVQGPEAPSPGQEIHPSVLRHWINHVTLSGCTIYHGDGWMLVNSGNSDDIQ